jgi:hypothetical protein
MERRVKVASFISRMEAEIAKSLLDSNGIPVQFKTDDMGGLQPALTLTGGVELWIDGDDLPDALRILNSSAELEDDV